MSCKICREPNHPQWSVTHGCLDALVERVATLESVIARQATDPTYAHPAEILGPPAAGPIVPCNCGCHRAANPTVDCCCPCPRRPPATGQLASNATYPRVDCRIRPGKSCHHEVCQPKDSPQAEPNPATPDRRS